MGRFSNLEQKYELPSGLLDATFNVESSGGKNLISKAGAKGPFQLMDSTAAQYGLKGRDVYDVNKSADAAARYYRDLIKMFPGDINKAIAAYNWGPTNVRTLGLGKAPDETRSHLQKMTSAMATSPKDFGAELGFTSPKASAQDFGAALGFSKKEIATAKLRGADAEVLMRYGYDASQRDKIMRGASYKPGEFTQGETTMPKQQEGFKGAAMSVLSAPGSLGLKAEYGVRRGVLQAQQALGKISPEDYALQNARMDVAQARYAQAYQPSAAAETALLAAPAFLTGGAAAGPEAALMSGGGLTARTLGGQMARAAGTNALIGGGLTAGGTPVGQMTPEEWRTRVGESALTAGAIGAAAPVVGAATPYVANYFAPTYTKIRRAVGQYGGDIVSALRAGKQDLTTSQILASAGEAGYPEAAALFAEGGEMASAGTRRAQQIKADKGLLAQLRERANPGGKTTLELKKEADQIISGPQQQFHSQTFPANAELEDIIYGTDTGKAALASAHKTLKYPSNRPVGVVDEEGGGVIFTGKELEHIKKGLENQVHQASKGSGPAANLGSAAVQSIKDDFITAVDDLYSAQTGTPNAYLGYLQLVQNAKRPWNSARIAEHTLTSLTKSAERGQLTANAFNAAEKEALTNFSKESGFSFDSFEHANTPRGNMEQGLLDQDTYGTLSDIGATLRARETGAQVAGMSQGGTPAPNVGKVAQQLLFNAPLGAAGYATGNALAPGFGGPVGLAVGEMAVPAVNYMRNLATAGKLTEAEFNPAYAAQLVQKAQQYGANVNRLGSAVQSGLNVLPGAAYGTYFSEPLYYNTGEIPEYLR